MKRHQLVQWILLPNGLTDDGMLAASVFVAPRLRPESPATLAEFPDFLAWPAALQGLGLMLERADGEQEAPMRVEVSAEPDLWSALFPHTTSVRAFSFDDLADRPLVSYPVREVLGYLRDRWARLAVDARDDLPVTSRNATPFGIGEETQASDRLTLADRFWELREAGKRGVFEGVETDEELSDRLRSTLTDAGRRARELRQRHATTDPGLIRPFGPPEPGPPNGPRPPVDTVDAFYALSGFHSRPMAEEPRHFPADREETRSGLEQKLDFHHHLSALGDHPAVLRRLGLVLDLVIRPDFVPLTPDGAPGVRLRLRVDRPSAFPPRAVDPDAEVWNVDVTPWTECRLTQIDGQAFFTAVEAGGRRDLAHGFLRLDPQRFDAVAVDVDGLALKALNMAATLERQDVSERRPLEEPERDGVPSARTGGVALVRAHRANDLHADFYRARAHDSALEADPEAPPVLAAQDLVRGYRLDVLAEGRWRSLHARRVTYEPDRNPGLSFTTEDEGTIQLSLAGEADTVEAPADPDGPLYLHESLATWDGWSLAAPRPGDVIEQEPAPAPATLDLGSTRLSLKTEVVPGTLPRLRFQSHYRLRGRAVDLAGNSHDLDTADHLGQVLEGSGSPQHAHVAPAGALVYRRFEPVPPPELVPRHAFGPGEGLERLVVRSSPDMNVASYAAASQSATEPSLRFRETCERHVAAAKASLQLVEAHGLLDRAIENLRGVPEANLEAAVQPDYDIAARENGSFRNAPGAEFVKTGEHSLSEGVTDEEGFVTIDSDEVELPYLPDPLAAGALARVTFEPDRPEVELRLPFRFVTDWYDPRPIRLVLGEGDYGADIDPAGRVLRVSLPAGRTASLRLSSLFEQDPEVFGILGWCQDSLSPNEVDLVYNAVANGTHWMTTPWRDLRLVHAVQRPLLPAELELVPDPLSGAGLAGGAVAVMPLLQRAEGSTTAQLRGTFFFDMPSTANLVLTASWEEVRDDPAATYRGAEEMVSQLGREVFTLPVPEPFGTPWVPEILTLVDPVGEGVLQFSTTGHWPAEQRRLQLLEDAKAPGLPTVERRRLEAGAAQLEKLRAHELGDTRYRRVTYTPSASTRFREYFDPAMSPEAGMSSGRPTTMDVLSSAPPAQPRVLQLLPLLDHAQASTAATVTSTRRGPGLRVWLGRGWYSSGAGELLAVACSHGPITANAELSREITLMLQDPTRVSTIPQPLLPESFHNAVLRVRNVPLHGVGTPHSARPRVSLAAFQPQWDARRQAWFCDIELSGGAAYFPFVRLGLARYQPMSITGCELSPIVPTVFVQTIPDRELTCTFENDDAHLTLHGPAPAARREASGTVVEGTNSVVCVVEAKDPRIAHEALGWTEQGTEVELAAELGGDGTATWRGVVQVPDGVGARQRLVIKEFEIHSSDDGTARRLVHLDIVPMG